MNKAQKLIEICEAQFPDFATIPTFSVSADKQEYADLFCTGKRGTNAMRKASAIMLAQGKDPDYALKHVGLMDPAEIKSFIAEFGKILK